MRETMERYQVDPGIVRAQIGYAEAVRGDQAYKENFLAALERLPPESQIPAYGMASIYAALGYRSEALDALERAYMTRESPLVWLKVSSDFDGLRAEPRFADLLRRIGLPP
jgi:hypothetical protein